MPEPDSCGCSEEEEVGVVIRAGLYFDGTQNNRTNSRTGGRDGGWDPNWGSYRNAISNVAKLEEAFDDYDEVDESLSVYIDGIGTIAGDNDYVVSGVAQGTGETGVESKVAIGIADMISSIKSTVTDTKIKKVTVDVFGFSRGAAAARHCVHNLLNISGRTLKDRLEAEGYEVACGDVHFAGLFDTVASHGTDHTDDTRTLNLNAISHCCAVAHLIAADEHRENFPLTNINSAYYGRQIWLPGVHSDIGGGYKAGKEEIQIFDIDSEGIRNSDAENQAIANARAWLVNTGWYRAAEIEDTTFFNEVNVERSSVAAVYDRIPLHIMAKLATDDGGCKYTGELRRSYPVTGTLAAIKTILDAYAQRITDKTSSRRSHWYADYSNDRLGTGVGGGGGATHGQIKTLRHDHLHFSAMYGTVGLAPNWNGGPITGYRWRVVHNG